MLEKLKLMLDIPEEDADLDKKLQLIIDSTKSRLKVKLNGNEVPEKLEYIVLEVAIVRFNRIGSEGMTINNVEGENKHFSSSDFTPYDAEISAYLESLQSTAQRGGFRFL